VEDGPTSNTRKMISMRPISTKLRKQVPKKGNSLWTSFYR